MENAVWQSTYFYGKRGEDIVAQFLQLEGMKIVSKATEKDEPDIVVTYINKKTGLPVHKEAVLEVKRDFTCTRTGSIAVEIGRYDLLKCYESKVWVNTMAFVIDMPFTGDSPDQFELIFISKKKLLEMTRSGKYKKITGGYAKLSTFYLIPKKDILENCNRSVIFKPEELLNNISSKEIDIEFYKMNKILDKDELEKRLKLQYKKYKN
jgi:hypothetical protein